MAHSASGMLASNQCANFDLQGLSARRSWTEWGHLERTFISGVSSPPCGRQLGARCPSRPYITPAVIGSGKSRVADNPVSAGPTEHTLMRRKAADSCDAKAPVVSPSEKHYVELRRTARQVQCRGVPVSSSDQPQATDTESGPSSTEQLGPDRQPKRVYKDTPFDLAFIQVCRQAYGKLAKWQVQWFSLMNPFFAACLELALQDA